MTSLNFTTFISLIPNQALKFLVLLCLLFCNTGEPTYTVLEERMVPGLLVSSECMPQLLITENSKVAISTMLPGIANEEHY